MNQTTEYLEFPKGNREHKSTLFCKVFEDKKYLLDLYNGVARAIDECIQEGILVDILKEQKAEVLELVLTTFNRELYEQGLKEDAKKEANQQIEDLKIQLADKDRQLEYTEKQLAELKEQIAKMKNE